MSWTIGNLVWQPLICQQQLWGSYWHACWCWCLAIFWFWVNSSLHPQLLYLHLMLWYWQSSLWSAKLKYKNSDPHFPQGTILNGQFISCSPNFDFSKLIGHPLVLNWQSLGIFIMSFSVIRDLTLYCFERQTGHSLRLGWQFLQWMWPLSHWKMGASDGICKQTGHSKSLK